MDLVIKESTKEVVKENTNKMSIFRKVFKVAKNEKEGKFLGINFKTVGKTIILF